jgi:extracellular matrix protein 14
VKEKTKTELIVVMFPFAYSCDDFPPDAEMLEEAALGVGKAMRTRHGEGYQAGQACDLTYRSVPPTILHIWLMYRAPGDAIDFAYGVADVRWSYSAELRDTGTVSSNRPLMKLISSTDSCSLLT